MPSDRDPHARQRLAVRRPHLAAQHSGTGRCDRALRDAGLNRVGALVQKVGRLPERRRRAVAHRGRVRYRERRSVLDDDVDLCARLGARQIAGDSGQLMGAVVDPGRVPIDSVRRVRVALADGVAIDQEHDAVNPVRIGRVGAELDRAVDRGLVVRRRERHLRRAVRGDGDARAGEAEVARILADGTPSWRSRTRSRRFPALRPSPAGHD